MSTLEESGFGKGHYYLVPFTDAETFDKAAIRKVSGTYTAAQAEAAAIEGNCVYLQVRAFPEWVVREWDGFAEWPCNQKEGEAA